MTATPGEGLGPAPTPRWPGRAAPAAPVLAPSPGLGRSETIGWRNANPRRTISAMRTLLRGLALVALAAACHSAPPAARQPAPSVAAGYNPARDLGPLFHDVQMARVFSDSK